MRLGWYVSFREGKASTKNQENGDSLFFFSLFCFFGVEQKRKEQGEMTKSTVVLTASKGQVELISFPWSLVYCLWSTLKIFVADLIFHGKPMVIDPLLRFGFHMWPQTEYKGTSADKLKLT